jgi:Ser/Thr protein kinase RdoA (MazF antagonist)
MEKSELFDIVSQFSIRGTVKEVKPLGNGLINDTFKVTTAESDQPDYVLQHVNNAIFTNVDMLMNNIVAVTSHIRRKLEAAGTTDIDRKVLSFVPDAHTGKYYFLAADGKYWRIMVFIPDAVTKTEVTPESSYDVGIAFGNFQAMLADIPEKLGETIPDFHNMEFRMQQLRDAVKADKAGRVAEMRPLIDAIMQDADEMCKGERLYREGKLPKRICHCDTKVDNLMFDHEGNVLCVIDLDTVMPNFVFSDIGDFLRSAANTSKEDEKDLSKVNFNFEIFKAFTKGYLKSAKSFLLPIEIENIPYAAMLFPFMQTVRFFADYLDGDNYYKIQYPEHNLVRSRAQWKLYQSVRAAVPQMTEFVQQCMREL